MALLTTYVKVQDSTTSLTNMSKRHCLKFDASFTLNKSRLNQSNDFYLEKWAWEWSCACCNGCNCHRKALPLQRKYLVASL